MAGTDHSLAKTIDADVLADPNQVLTRAIAQQAIDGQNIESFVTFTLTSAPDKKNYFGGGTSNIGFLQGNDDTLKAAQATVAALTTENQRAQDAVAHVGNAHAVQMKVTYWIETVSFTVKLQPNQTGRQSFRMKSNSGVVGPKFTFPATANSPITKETPTKVTWTQIQYSQNVTMNFNGLSWPHISVATLGDTSTYNIDKLPPSAP
jgi:hypothetical protein